MTHIPKHIFIFSTFLFFLTSLSANAQYQKIIASFDTLKPIDRARLFLGSIEELKLSADNYLKYIETGEQYALTHNDKILLREVHFMKDLNSAGHNPKLATLEAWAEKYKAQGKTLEVGYWHHVMAQINFSQRDYSAFFENCFKAMEIFEETGFENIPPISKFLHDFALIYYYLKEYKEVIKLMKLSLEHPPFNANHHIQRYNNLAMAYLETGLTDSAKYYLKETHNVAEKYQTEIWKILANNNLGNVYYREGAYQEALKYYQKVLDHKRRDGDIERSSLHIDVYINMAKTLLKFEKVQLTKSFLDSAGNSFYANTVLPYYGDEQQLEKAKGKYFEVKLAYLIRIGDYKNALRYKDSLLRTQKFIDDKYNSSTAKMVADKLLIQKKELKITQREKEKADLRSFYIALVSGLIIIGGTAYAYLFISRQKKKRLNEKLIAQNKINLLEKEQAEKELQLSKKEINQFILKINEHTGLVSKLEKELSKLQSMETNERKHINDALKQLKLAKILTDDDWLGFLQNFERAFPELSIALKTYQPSLSISEMRYLMLTQLGFSNKEMARAIGVSEAGIRLTLSRVRKKLNGNLEDTPQTLLDNLYKKASHLQTEIS